MNHKTNTYKHSTSFLTPASKILITLAFILLSLTCFLATSQADTLTIPSPQINILEHTFSGSDISKWSQRKIGDSLCRVSAIIAGPSKAEFNFHRITADFTGPGTLEVSIGYSTSSNINTMIEKKHLHSSFRKLQSGKEVMVTSPYKGQRYVWLIVRTTDRVVVNNMKYSSRMSSGSLYGHIAGKFSYGGAKLPYRLMYPKNYDSKKSYPLVVSVSGSGGVGSDNHKSMEMVTLARYLYTNYYHNKEFECFSLVPQIPTITAIPAPFWPKGTKGIPSEFHPDWPTVNAGGWFTQASIQLIKELAASSDVNIDADRVYMTGFSYGGKACWEFLRAEPAIFAAVASGGGWPIGRCYSKPDTSLLKQLKKEVSLYKDVPAVIFAGGKDGMRFGSAAVNKEILAQGGKTKFTIYKGAGHVQSAGKGWRDVKNIKWLFQNKKQTKPKTP